MMIASASHLEENVAACFEICFRMSHATRELKFPKEKVMKNDDDLDLGLDFDADSDTADEGVDDEILLDEETTTVTYTVTSGVGEFDDAEEEGAGVPAAPPSRPKAPKPAARPAKAKKAVAQPKKAAKTQATAEA